jgi:hypothetical protein
MVVVKIMLLLDEISNLSSKPCESGPQLDDTFNNLLNQ